MPPPKPVFESEPVKLPAKTHYEDLDTVDEKLKDLVPLLRKQQLQKEAEQRYQNDQLRAAKKQREEFEKANRTLMSKVKKGAELEVADMGLTYDDHGKVLKIKS